MSDLRNRVVRWQHGMWNLMARNQIRYSVPELPVRTSQLMLFRLLLHDPADLKKIFRLDEQLGLVLGCETPRVVRQGHYVHVEVPLEEGDFLPLPARYLPQKGGTKVTFGQTCDGQRVTVDLASDSACHTLVAGRTGSGKTVAQHLIAWSLAQSGERRVRLIIIDGKGGDKWREWTGQRALASPVIYEPNEAVRALAWVVAEIERRKAGAPRTPRLFVVIDEITELLNYAPGTVGTALMKITKLGREIGVHAVVGTQHPLTGEVGGSVAKANFTLRLTGVVAEAQTAYLATGVKGSGAECLRGKGDFVMTMNGQASRLQMAMVHRREFCQLPRTDEPAEIEFDVDPDRILGGSGKNGKAELEPAHIAYAIAHDCGINRLQRELGVGGRKGTDIRRFAKAVIKEMVNLGIPRGAFRIPHSEMGQNAPAGAT
jgi:hypothetical protein